MELLEVAVDLTTEELLETLVLVLLEGTTLDVRDVLMLEELLEDTLECALEVAGADDKVLKWLLEETLEDPVVEGVELVPLLLDWELIVDFVL